MSLHNLVEPIRLSAEMFSGAARQFPRSIAWTQNRSRMYAGKWGHHESAARDLAHETLAAQGQQAFTDRGVAHAIA